MANLTLRAAVQVDGGHIVTRSVGNSRSTAAVALIFDSTLTKYEIQQAVAALNRNLSRLFLKTDLPSEVPTSGTDRE